MQILSGNVAQFNPTFVLTLSASEFVERVHGACFAITQWCAPLSKQRVDPEYFSRYDASTPFTDAAALICHQHLLGDFRAVDGHAIYMAMMTQVEFLGAAAGELDRIGIATPGMEWWTQRLVYQSLVLFHNWKVETLHAKIAKRGLNFGSATAWHTHNVTKVVAHWPDKWPKWFTLPGMSFDESLKTLHEVFPIRLLPCEEPDFEERRAAETAADAQRRITSTDGGAVHFK